MGSNIGLDVGRRGEHKGSNSGWSGRRPMRDEGDPPRSLEKRVLEKTGAETACGAVTRGTTACAITPYVWVHPGRGAVRDVTSAGFSFHHARSLLNERKGRLFLLLIICTFLASKP